MRLATSPKDHRVSDPAARHAVRSHRIHRGLLNSSELGWTEALRIRVGLALSGAAYHDDRIRLAVASARSWSAFADADAILFTATPQTAPLGLASIGDAG